MFKKHYISNKLVDIKISNFVAPKPIGRWDSSENKDYAV